MLGGTFPDAKIADAIVAANSASGLNDLPVAICFDADDAGRAGSERLANLLVDRAVRTTVVAPPPGMDLTQWIATDPRCAARLAVEGLANQAARRRTRSALAGPSIGGHSLS